MVGDRLCWEVALISSPMLVASEVVGNSNKNASPVDLPLMRHFQLPSFWQSAHSFFLSRTLMSDFAL